MSINLRTLIERLARDRYMGALIYGEAGGERGVGKSEFLRRFQEAHADLRVFYLDAQHAIQEQGTPQIVFELTPGKFLEWSLAQIPESEKPELQALLLDNFDVIVNLWDARKKEEFAHRVQRLERVVFPVPVIAMAQTDVVFEKAYQQQGDAALRRIVRFRDLEAV